MRRPLAAVLAAILVLAHVGAGVALVGMASGSAGADGSATLTGPPGMTGVPDDQVAANDSRAIGRNGEVHRVVDSPGGGPGNAPGGGPPDGVLPSVARENVPDRAIEAVQSVSEARLESEVLASDHPETLSAELVPTVDGDVGLVLSDDTNSEGRRVAVPTDVLVDALGFRPEAAYGTHESGDRWEAPIQYRDGYAVVRVPHFSTNTIEFVQEVRIDATGAQNGSTWSYQVADDTAVDNYNVTVTGREATEWTNVSGSTPTAGSFSYDVAGNLEPSGPAGDPRLNLSMPSSADYQASNHSTFSSNTAGQVWGDTYANEQINTSWQIDIDDSIKYLAAIRVKVYSVSGDPSEIPVDIVAEPGTPDKNPSDGIVVKEDWRKDPSTGNLTIEFDRVVDVSSWDNLSITFISQRTDGDGNSDQVKVTQTSDGGGYCNLDDSCDSRLGHMGAYSGNRITVTDNTGVSDTLLIGPGVSNVTTLDLSNSSSSIDLTHAVSSTNSLDYDLRVQERQAPVDPTVEVNGNSTEYAGMLDPGTTVDLTTDPAWVANGTNDVSLTIQDPETGAPTPEVNLTYVHDSVDAQTVDYTSGTWVERYNVSHTYADEPDTAELRIPFANDVVQIVDIEKRINGSGGWTDVSKDSYDLTGTDLTVDLGTPDPDTTVEVRVNGSRVNARDGSISVVEVAGPNEDVDTEFTVSSPGSNFRIEVGADLVGDRVHYLYNESWSNASEYARFQSDGSQVVYVPNAQDGDTARVATIPVEVRPLTGDVEVTVEDPKTTEPEFVVSSGSSAGDAVEFTFVDATDGESYVLYSITDDVVRDSGTANSPITLEDDDGEETLQFQLDSSASASSGGGGGSDGDGGGGGIVPGTPSSFPILWIALAGLVLLALVYWFLIRDSGSTDPSRSGRQSGGSGGILTRIGGAVEGLSGLTLVGILVGLALLVGLYRGTIRLNQQTVQIFGVLGAIIGSYVLLRRMGSFSWLGFGVVATAGSVIGLELLAPGTISSAIGAGLEQILPLLAIAGIYLVYQYLQARKTPDETVELDIQDGGGS